MCHGTTRPRGWIAFQLALPIRVEIGWERAARANRLFITHRRRLELRWSVE